MNTTLFKTFAGGFALLFCLTTISHCTAREEQAWAARSKTLEASAAMQAEIAEAYPAMPAEPAEAYSPRTAYPAMQPETAVPPRLLAVGGPSAAEATVPSEPASDEPQERGAQEKAGIFTDFVAVLHSGVWEKHVLGPAAFEGGYVVDITPLDGAADGTHVQHKVLPEFDGEQWNDVLSMLIDEETDPLRVRVRVYTISDWPVAFQARLTLTPGEWQGHIVREAKEDGGYVIEINPLEPGQIGDTIEKTIVQMEYFMQTWYDVLRIIVPAAQQTMAADVKVYRTPPYLRVAAEYDVHLEPGNWPGYGVGLSKLDTGYVIEVTPVDFGPKDEMKGCISLFTVQPEFDGKTWNDVARLMEEPGWPVPADAHVRVYAVEH